MGPQNTNSGPAPATTEGAAGEILTALRPVFRRRAQPLEALFKLATAFTHPRRVEVFRAVKNGTDSFGKLQAATQISARALTRHLAKLEARGFVKSEMEVYPISTGRCLENTQSLKESSGMVGMTVAVRQQPPKIEYEQSKQIFGRNMQQCGCIQKVRSPITETRMKAQRRKDSG